MPLKEGLGSERRPKDKGEIVDISNTSSKLHKKNLEQIFTLFKI
jgi:hypothetical protein